MDQHRFLESKQQKSKKVEKEMLDRELKEVKKTPQINKSSRKQTGTLAERQQSTSFNRLYDLGKKKQMTRNQTIDLTNGAGFSMTVQAAIEGNLHLIQGAQNIVAEMTNDVINSPRGDTGPAPRNLHTGSSSALGQRAKPRYESLYERHQQNQQKQKQMKEKYDSMVRQDSARVFETLQNNKMSEKMRVQGFHKEFSATLSYIKHREQMLYGSSGEEYGNTSKPVKLEIQKEKITFDVTALLMHSMGYLTQKKSEGQEQQVDDIYHILKMEKSDVINAASLCNILGVITGIKDTSILLQDTPAGAFSPVGVFGLDPNESAYKPGQTWEDAGVIDPIDGYLKFKNSEVPLVFEHFKLLRLNRRAQKRDFQSQFRYSAKERSLSEFGFHPTINANSIKMADQKRQKLNYISPDGRRRADIVQILLHPKDNSKLEKLKQYKEFKEAEELTLKPKILSSKKNNRLLSARDGIYTSMDGRKLDRNLALYESSKMINMRKKHNQSVDFDAEFERQAGECSFRPQINEDMAVDIAIESVHVVKDSDKFTERMKRARQERQFKKLMTERSNFSATKGVKDAYNKVKPLIEGNDLTATEQKSMPVVFSEKKRFKGFAGVNAEQMKPSPSKVRATSASKNWPALHVPKRIKGNPNVNSSIDFNSTMNQSTSPMPANSKRDLSSSLSKRKRKQVRGPMAKKDIDQDEPKEPENLQINDALMPSVLSEYEETKRVKKEDLIEQHDSLRVP